MIKTKQQVQPSSHAHATGVVNLIYFATAILGLFLSGRKLPVGAMMAWPSDMLYATLTILLYRLFRPANRSCRWWRPCSAWPDASQMGCTNCA